MNATDVTPRTSAEREVWTRSASVDRRAGAWYRASPCLRRGGCAPPRTSPMGPHHTHFAAPSPIVRPRSRGRARNSSLLWCVPNPRCAVVEHDDALGLHDRAHPLATITTPRTRPSFRGSSPSRASVAASAPRNSRQEIDTGCSTSAARKWTSVDVGHPETFVPPWSMGASRAPASQRRSPWPGRSRGRATVPRRSPRDDRSEGCSPRCR